MGMPPRKCYTSLTEEIGREVFFFIFLFSLWLACHAAFLFYSRERLAADTTMLSFLLIRWCALRNEHIITILHRLSPEKEND